MIITLTPKKGELPRDAEWLPSSMIYKDGNTGVYDGISNRASSVINKLGGNIPSCVLMAQTVYYNKDEVLYKVFVKNDVECEFNGERVVEELNRVVITRN